MLKPGPESGIIFEALALLAQSGACDRAVDAAEIAHADALAQRGTSGLLGAMLRVPAWQWRGAPEIAAVSSWLWAEYTKYLFYSPQGFIAMGQAEAYGEHILARLTEMARLVTTSREPAAAQAALVYLKVANCVPLYFSTDTLRRHYELRGRILGAAVKAGQPRRLDPRPRGGRKLRVGFINRHFGPQTETYTTLPMFEQLDPERFETILFVHHRMGAEVEKYAESRVTALRLLPEGVAAQLAMLREAALDVAVFGTNLTAVTNEVTLLALHRIAPLQVVNNSSCTTTGLPEIDLYVSGTLTETAEAPRHFSERLGLVAGPTHAFNYEADRVAATTQWTRAELGLPEDAVVFVSAANYFKIIPEMRRTWARLLAAVPGSRLLLHPFNPNWSSSYPIKRFHAEFSCELAAHGVDPARLVLSSNRFPSRTDVKQLLAVGDVYLDTWPFGGVNSLVDPLELGMPAIVWEGGTMRARMGAALLRALKLDSLIATTEDEYLALAAQLAGDPQARAALSASIREQMESAPVFLDSLAASDAFGALVESSFDELVRLGRQAFRATAAPVVVKGEGAFDAAAAALESGDLVAAESHARRALGATPVCPSTRTLFGRILLAQGRADRAVTYLLAALQHAGNDGMVWYYSARALQKNGQISEALQALEGCLKADPRCLDGWCMLLELATEAKNDSLFAEALEAAQQIAPDDARIVRWSSTLAGVAAARPPHVLLYTDDPALGGVAQYNHTLLLALARAGYRVTCMQTESDSPLAREQREHGIAHRWVGYDTGKEFARTLTDRASFEQMLGEDRPDFAIFSDCCPLSNLGARQAALDAGVPYMTVVGFVGAYLAKNFAAYLPQLARQHAAARAVVAVSTENLDLLRRHFGTPESLGEVIHYGRPEQFFQPIDAAVRARLRAELGLPADAVVSFTAARLSAVKGLNLQLAALQALKGSAAYDRLALVWAGEGDQRAELESEILRRGLQGKVHLLGHRWDVAHWYDAADFFTLSSQLEGMPLCIMEAMAKGLPVVATAVSGIPEELGDTGQLLPNPAVDATGAVRDLARTMAAWALDVKQRQRVGAAGRVRADMMFRESLMLQRTLALVQRQLPVPR